MLSAHAALSVPSTFDADDTIATSADLQRVGWTRDAVAGQIKARRWQRSGRAIVRHNGACNYAERCRIALINSGRRSVLTSFTALEALGLAGWHRPSIHVLVPAGTRRSRSLDSAVVLHYSGDWDAVQALVGRPVQRFADALVLAAASFASVRPAVGLIAAGVQQRKVRPEQLRSALTSSPRLRHRRILAASVDDIAQGSQALSEIDFVELCRRAKLPIPNRQAVRMTGGKRRYFDAEWDLDRGRRLVAEVDGALHLVAARWFDDQLRQNEIALDGATVLRYPSFFIRSEPNIVADQLRRALSRRYR